jgi:hypothetical protein
MNRKTRSNRMLRTITHTPKCSMLAAALVSSSIAWVGAAAPAQADGRASAAHYSGLDGNWFNAANWSTGRVPGPDTDVVLDGLDNVTIGGPADVQIRDLVVRDRAHLSTLAGTVLRSRDERLAGFGTVIHRSTQSTGERLSAEQCMSCMVVLNPSPKQKRIIVLQSSFVPQSMGGGLSVEFGLGGRQAASPGHVGPGHYATLTAETAVLGGRLALATHYSFSPAPGDRFAIVTAGAVRGRFANAAEGALVARFGDVGLLISYGGGDGNDVVLTAVALR